MGHKKTLERKSKYLSMLLRHTPETLNLTMDPKGWVSVPELIDKRVVSIHELKEIVESDPKGRYEVTPDYAKIRAVSGHSIPWVNPDLTEPSIIPEVLYHGTSAEGLEMIKSDGFISKMGRNYIHLTEDLDEAFEIGRRHGKPCVLELRAKEMTEAGLSLIRPTNNRYFFCENNIPVEYIKNIIWSCTLS